MAPLSPQKIYQLEPNDRQRKRRQRTSETVAGIVPYESSLAEHGLKFPEVRGRRLPTTLPDIYRPSSQPVNTEKDVKYEERPERGVR